MGEADGAGRASSRDTYPAPGGQRFYDGTRHLNDPYLSDIQRMSILQDAADEEMQSGMAVPTPWYIVMPFYTWKSNWDLMVLGLVIVSSYMIPFDVAYRSDIDPKGCGGSFLDPECSFGMVVDSMEMVLLAVFVMDLCVSFFVSFQNDDGHWQISVRDTARHYMHTWLIIDLLAIIPFEQFATSDAAVLSMSKVLRLLRLGKLLKRSQNLVTSTRAVLSRFLRMLVFVLLLTHWFACLLRYVSPPLDQDVFFGEIAESWGMGGLYVFDLYSSLCVLLGESLVHDNPTDEQKVIAIFTMLVGAVVLAAVFGNVAMLVANYNISKTRLIEKMEQVNESMKSCRLPKDLQMQIRQYYAYSWTRHKAINAQSFFDDLSPGLRSKTTFYLYQDVLCSVPLFSKAPVAVLETLALAVRASVYMPNDVIIREGMYGEDMYIVGDGRVVVSSADGVMVAVLGRGAFFGEMALLSEDRRRANRVEAESICDVYCLHKRDLDHIFVLYPKLKGDMLREVAKRKHMNATMFEATVGAAHNVSQFASRLQRMRDTSNSSEDMCYSSFNKKKLCAFMRSKKAERQVSPQPACCLCDGEAADRIAEQACKMREEAAAAAQAAVLAREHAASEGFHDDDAVSSSEDVLERVKREHMRCFKGKSER